MKVRLKKKSLQLRTLLALAFQIASLQSAQTMEYEAFLLNRIDRNLLRTESLSSPETPFSWSHCFDCFYWHDEEQVKIPPTLQKAKNSWDGEYFPVEWAAYLPPHPGGYHW